MLVGYARVSSVGQSLDIQLDALKAAGCEKVFAEKRSGTTAATRMELQAAVEFVREGDTLVVTRLDRLARSASDLYKIVSSLSEKGVGFRCMQQDGLNTTTSAGKLMMGILAAIAEFETDIRKERQREGIERAKAAGVYKGRKRSVDRDKVRSLRSSGESPTAIAKRMGISRASVYRALANVE